MALFKRLNSKVLKTCQVYSRRNFLSESFELKVEWNERLKSPIFGQIEAERYFLDIDRQYSRTGLISHIDLDIFANGFIVSKDQGIVSKKSEIETRMEQATELIRRFRSTPENIKILDSTPHAIVRNCADVQQIDQLIKILNNPLKFGLFLDDYCTVYLLNKMIKSENWRDASKVGILMMLQEEFTTPIASQLATYSTLKYVLNMTNEDVWDPIPDEVEPEPEDEVKIRVFEVENPDFDEHFDLVKKEHLLGKTLAKFGQHGMKGSIIDESLQLLGYTLLEKFDKVNQIAQGKEFSKECVELALKYAAQIENQELESKLKSVKTNDSSALEGIKSKIASAIDDNEAKFIENQIQTYKDWNANREKLLEMQHQRSIQEAKLQEIQQKKYKMDEEEKKLFFFENYEDMEKEKRAKYLQWTRTFPKKTGVLFGKQIRMGLRDKNVPLISRRDRIAAKSKK